MKIQHSRLAEPAVPVLTLSALGTALALLSTPSQAFQFDTGVEGLTTSWDNTVKYSNAFRVHGREANVSGGPGSSVSNINMDDGDRNFGTGLISNRFDLLSELDIKYGDVGGRLSGAAWYDSVYNQSNDNNSPSTANAVSVAHDHFTDDTKELHGRDGELLDAFVYGGTDVGSTRLTGRLGQFTQIYGESLFFGANGIANAQSTVDLVKLQSVPGSQFKEILLPTQQVSGNWQLTDSVSIGAYYQFKWDKTRLPASGSYFSGGDFVGDGAESVYFPTGRLLRGQSINAKDTGQFGAQLKFSVADWEFGLYAARYNDKTPIWYFRPAALVPGDDDTFVNVYPEDIKVYGASFSTLVGEANVAGEVSMRVDTPLAPTGGVVITDMSADNNNHAAYPIGDSLHANLSMINVYGGSALWDGASFVGELAFNRRLKVKENADQLDPNTTRDAYSMRFTFEPQYFQVFPGVDVQVPLTVGYTPYGRSSVTPQAFSPEHGGDFTLALKADYQKAWYASLSYTNFFGAGGSIIDDSNAYTFKQTLKDRDFIAFSVQRTF
ncbi:DUF1302 domain-containing protein [Pseudomonas aeruginosa]|uniref:DUF1302 domain-containing protein n=1 Tax=Pseudomonas aeruginosa TaxID=287 RepID=UPI000EB3095F|nr:DUF1302 domain-containing protein [Pseudomonas aeruginosa]HBO3146299.1 DUF1302 domain-containing protein [Pseudomonas aeruginosa]HCL4166293.1 DUF1302 domain-containing protein [Pseudomonas aeruginosa]